MIFMRFERENNTSYLVLDEEPTEEFATGELSAEEFSVEESEDVGGKDECSDMEYKMIRNNSIDGLLLMHQRIINGKSIYYYDITSKQQMSKLYSYAQLKLEDVLMICESISLMVKDINMYMLDLGKIILEPDYMFVDISEKKVKFVYYPRRQQQEDGCDNGIRRLFEYILEHFDHSVEKEQLMTMYMIYQKVVQKEYNLENFNEIVKDCSAEIVKECKVERQKEKLRDDAYAGHAKELTETEEVQLHQGFSDKISIDAVPAENIEDEVEIENDKLLKYQKWIKIISIAIIIFGILKILIPGLIPLPINITASALLVALGAAALAVVSAIPKYLFVKMQPRKSRQKYEVLFEMYEREDERYIESGEAAESIESVESDMPGVNGGNSRGGNAGGGNARGDASVHKNNLPYDTSQEPQTMLLSDYIKFSGSQSKGIKLVAKETQEMVEIVKFPCLIGSMKEKCDKVIEEKLVSRLHCCVSGCKEGYYIEDMNSTNGTFVNGERLLPNNRHILNNGDEVRLATYIYKVEIS